MTLDLLTQPDIYVSLLTLTAMEIVLGIDNVIFTSILAGKLPPAQQPVARQLGLALALVLRLALLLAISWVMDLTAPLFAVFDHTFSGRAGHRAHRTSVEPGNDICERTGAELMGGDHA